MAENSGAHEALASLAERARAHASDSDMVDAFLAAVGPVDPDLRAHLLALLPGHPVRLGLVLNYVVTHYEVIKENLIEKRRIVEAFDKLVSEWDQLDEASYRYGPLIKKVLMENLEKYRAGHGQA